MRQQGNLDGCVAEACSVDLQTRETLLGRRHKQPALQLTRSTNIGINDIDVVVLCPIFCFQTAVPRTRILTTPSSTVQYTDATMSYLHKSACRTLMDMCWLQIARALLERDRTNWCRI